MIMMKKWKLGAILGAIWVFVIGVQMVTLPIANVIGMNIVFLIGMGILYLIHYRKQL